MLPTCMNLNPRSIYNKAQEFITFIKEHSIHCVFLSESWERPEFNLSQLLDIEDFMVISNPHQRTGQGGRPALLVNTKYYHVRNLTNTLIQIPWGCEATWAMLTPKNATNSSKIQKIAVGSIYSKPNSRNKTKLLDHISHAYNVISAKYQTGLHYIIAGDTNELKLDSILQLNPQMQQLVKGFTRLDPPRILDPILTTLGAYYQTPEILPPLGPDPDKDGKPSDHLIPVMRPINIINNKCARSHRTVIVRPILQSGMNQLKSWMSDQSWSNILDEESINSKAAILQECVLDKINQFLPEKRRLIASDDDPWVSEDVKKLSRCRQREYRKKQKLSKIPENQSEIPKEVKGFEKEVQKEDD